MPSRSPELALQSQFIRAGAGAGKTTKLISSFLDFATEFKNKHQRLPRIIMTTFTRKATQEVKERLSLTSDESEMFKLLAGCSGLKFDYSWTSEQNKAIIDAYTTAGRDRSLAAARTWLGVRANTEAILLDKIDESIRPLTAAIIANVRPSLFVVSWISTPSS